MLPTTVVEPPITSMASIVTETSKLKVSGAMKSAKCAQRAPARPPYAADSVKAATLYRVLSTPTASAASSFSRIALRARPMRERETREATKMASAKKRKTR